ncbi:MAG: tRNA pseudouridine(55) synthase TruB [Saprospiraceae bacterium]|nr:tRNA pseudouridine(55) synthase TruB [Saprospiraceae bacterium]
MDSIDFNDGFIILIDKPLRVTSFYVVDQIQKAYKRTRKQKLKIGHAGTLDPLATGLLILCTGKMTKKISQFQDMEKTYSGTFQLGASTPSYDLETEVENHKDISTITQEDLERTRNSFMGYQELKPPAHSAIKLNGKRAYELARKGLQPEMPLKPLYISRFDLDTLQLPELSFRISCTKGTYIRSIANEFGARLNNAAYLSSLHRESIGDFSASTAFSLDGFLEKLNSNVDVI